MKRHPLRAVSLFSGAGGFDLGAQQAGIETVLAVEWAPDAAATYRAAFPHTVLHTGDVRDQDFDAVGHVDIVFGSPPCQPFSAGGQHRGRVDPRDMIPAFIEAVRVMQPRAFVMENVPGLATRPHDAYLSSVLQRLAMLGYSVNWTVLDAVGFGVPQRRRRWFCAGFSAPETARMFGWPRERGDRVAIGEALDDMHDLLPVSLIVSRRVAAWAAGTEYSPIAVKHEVMGWNAPAHTVTANWRRGGYYGLVYTPRGLRRIGPRAAARLQGFPDDWPWYGSASSVSVQVGNAVPPPMGYAVMSAVVSALRSVPLIT